MKVTPPLAVAPLAQENDLRWNLNVTCDETLKPSGELKGAARPITTASALPQHPTRIK